MQQTVYALAVSPAFEVDSVVFAAGDEGLFRSADGGATWQPAYASLQLDEPLPATAVALSPRFAIDNLVFAGAPGGVLRSADGGATWVASALPAPPPTVSALVVSPDFAQDGLVIAGTSDDGVFRSTDRGLNWQPWNFGLLDMHVLALATSPSFAADRIVYAAAESGIFVSANGGRSWDETAFPMQFAPVLALAISPSFAEDGTLYAGTEEHGLLRSRDGGASWTRVAEYTIDGAVNGILLAPEYPAVPRRLLLGDGLLLARDGEDWSRLGTAEPVAVAAPAGLADGAMVLVGVAEGGVRRVTIGR